MLDVIPAFIQDDPEFSEQPLLVLIHDGAGTTTNYYLLEDLDRHVWGISNMGLDNDTAWPGGINQIAQTYVDLIQSELPRGPLILGGWSVGGLIAFEMAKVFAENGRFPVLGVIMIDTFYPSAGNDRISQDPAAIQWGEATTEESKQKAQKSMANCSLFAQQWGQNSLKRDDTSAKLPPVVLLRANENHDVAVPAKAEPSQGDHMLGWEHYQHDFFSQVLTVPGNHYSLFNYQNLDDLTESLFQACEILEDASNMKISSVTLNGASTAPQLSIPLLRTIVNNQDIKSVLPCSGNQHHVLTSTEDFGRQTILFKLQVHQGEDISVDRLQHAWQKVVQRRPELRTVIAMGSGTTDLFQVVLKTHVVKFAHVHLSETDDLDAKVEREPLPDFAPEAPMHMIHFYTTDSGPSLLRLCYSGIAIDSDTLVGIQTDLPRYYRSLTSPEPHPEDTLVSQKREDPPSYMLEWISDAEPTVLGQNVVDFAKSEKTMVEYTNVTMPGSLGKALLRRCSDDGVAATNMLQTLWLSLLRKYLNLEQPCCRYTLTSNDKESGNYGRGAFTPRDSLCSVPIADHDQVTDVAKRLCRQTMDDRRVGQISSTALYNGKRLCNSTICWQDHTVASDGFDGYWSLEPTKANGFAEYDVAFTLIYTGAELLAQLQTVCTIERWLAKSITDMFVQSLEFILSHPSCRIKDIPSCSQNDIKVIQRWNKGYLHKQQSCIHEIIRDQTQLHPDAPAIVAHDGSLSYHDLEALTNRLSHSFFTKFAFQPEENVILMLPHSIWAIVAMVAVMKAGSAFIPLDESTPLDRVKSIASKSNARFVITTRTSAAKHENTGLEAIILDQSFVDQETLSTMNEWTNQNVKPSNLAYIIFTSGSTGEPKGCAIEHQAFCSSALVYGPKFRLGVDSRILQFASHAFDASLVEILAGLLSGSCICVPSDHDRMNNIGQAAMRMEANWAMLTPSLVSRLNIETAKCIKTLVLVGEPLTAHARDAWAHRVDLLGGYGPSEAGPISAVVGPLTSQSHPTNIGYPVANKSWVVDASNHDQLVPVGAIGELLLESYSLGRGYIGDEERTSQVFIENPEWTKRPEFRNDTTIRRMYKTGDLVMRCGDGSLQYIGRKDMQIKLQGQRVELGDIETHLKTVVPAELAVEVGVPRGCQEDEKLLVAYLCLGPESTVSDNLSSVDTTVQAQLHALLGNVEEILSSKIARYMLPVAYLPLRTLPMTVSGKRDRRKLQQMVASLDKQELLAWRVPNSVGRPLVTEMDRRVASLWAGVLKIETDELSLDDDFIKRGGDSLAAMRLGNLAKDAGLSLSFKDIYHNSRLLGDQVDLCIKRGQGATGENC
ncbi:acetyl-CoA synthetase-like protein [Xylariaceae sp. AK1471]|nr:acetyl-CoA synthetase-like protein [Xylariaceae sp. AK1471]